MGSHSHSFSKDNEQLMRKRLENKFGRMTNTEWIRYWSEWQMKKLRTDPNYDMNDDRQPSTGIDNLTRSFYPEINTDLDITYTPKKPKEYKSQSKYESKPIDHNLNSVMDQIKNKSGKYKVSKREKLGQDYFTSEMMRRRDLSSDSDSSGGGIGIGFVIAFIMVAVFLVIALMIFSEFDQIFPSLMNNVNATSNYPVDENAISNSLIDFAENNFMLVIMLFIIPVVLLTVTRLGR